MRHATTLKSFGSVAYSCNNLPLIGSWKSRDVACRISHCYIERGIVLWTASTERMCDFKIEELGTFESVHSSHGSYPIHAAPLVSVEHTTHSRKMNVFFDTPTNDTISVKKYSSSLVHKIMEFRH